MLGRRSRCTVTHGRRGSLAFLREIYPSLVAAHRLPRPTAAGRAAPRCRSFMHPWESGLDNSPAWDRDLAEMVIPAGAMPPYVRHDLDHATPADRPTNEAYDRFVFLAARYRDSGYDDARLLDQIPFLVAGPLFNAIYLWSTHALAEIAEVVGADPVPHREQAQRIHEALLTRAVGPGRRALQRARHREQRAGAEDTSSRSRRSSTPTCRRSSSTRSRRPRVGELPSGRPDGFVAPSFDLLAEGFDERHYWRGPIGSTPTGCCGRGSASTASRRPPRKSS